MSLRPEGLRTLGNEHAVLIGTDGDAKFHPCQVSDSTPIRNARSGAVRRRPARILGGHSPPRNAVTQLEEWAFDGEEQDRGGGVNAELHADESGGGGRLDVMAQARRHCVKAWQAELADEMDDEFLNQISAVGNAGDEGDAGNSYSTKRKSRADGAN